MKTSTVSAMVILITLLVLGTVLIYRYSHLPRLFAHLYSTLENHLEFLQQEMETPRKLLCELRAYQKQALHWMTQLEKGNCTDEAATMLHPCWEAYYLADK